MLKINLPATSKNIPNAKFLIFVFCVHIMDALGLPYRSAEFPHLKRGMVQK
jgi:hypothetical protein